MELEDLDLYERETPHITPIPSGAKTLDELNINNELLELYQNAKQFLEDITSGGMSDVPANQIAQVMNTLITSLKEITKVQVEVYNAELVKKMESATIMALKLAPKEVQVAFFEEYTRLMQS